jgi:hypothetical protein
MITASPAARAGQESVSRRGWRTPVPADCPDLAPAAQAAVPVTAAPAGHGRGVRSWPLLLLAVPAAVTVWSGWVGIGAMTGFGQVHPLPGIWDSLHLDTAVTLPVGVEAYAAYALRAWLTAGVAVSGRARRFARWSAIGSLLLGAAGQAAYHLLAEARTIRAPWGITTAVSCLPVLVLGMGAALTHLLRTDAHSGTEPALGAIPLPDQAADRSAVPGPHQPVPGPPGPGHLPRPAAPRVQARLAEARAAAAPLAAAGQRVSRRTLRAAGLHGSNADLGTIARILATELTTTHSTT